jgi:HK97 family phage prohead protease
MAVVVVVVRIFQSVSALPAEMFVTAVEGHDDLFKFRYDFELQGKALDEGKTGAVVTELEDGDLLIEGWAAVWEDNDRQGENFVPGSFQNGIDRFLSGQAALCYHHKHDACLGKVLELKEEGKGLKMRARVDGAIQRHPTLGVIYDQIKRGTFNGLSTFGYFTRGVGELANKIVKTDLVEVSVTPVPVHPGTSLTVLAGKALASDVALPEPPKVEASEEIREADLESINFLIGELDGFFRRIEESVGKRKETSA